MQRGKRKKMSRRRSDPSHHGAIAIFLCCLLLGAWGDASGDVVDNSSIEDSISRGVSFLVDTQHSNGSWGSARQTKGLNIYAPVPGAHHAFRTAVTAMGVMALIESGRADSGEPRQALEAGIEFLLQELPRVRRATADTLYNVWTHCYGIQALVLILERSEHEEERKQVVELIRNQIDRLIRYESVNGGWGYYDFNVGAAKPSSSPTSFTTASILVALKRVEGIPGVEVPQRIIDRAVATINRQRKADLSYMYAEYLKHRPMYPVNRPGGSLARSHACNYALRIWGDSSITNQDIDGWLEKLESRNGWLDIGRKRPVPHEAWFQVAGYFFYYGHYYAALCLELLPPDAAAKHGNFIAGIMLRNQEKDGSWWDFPFYSYHKPYGTAYAILTLVRCRE